LDDIHRRVAGSSLRFRLDSTPEGAAQREIDEIFGFAKEPAV